MSKMEDLAGRLPNGFMVTDRIVSAGQIRRSDVDLLVKSGYGMVVDLRAPNEPRNYDEAQAVKNAGLRYVNIPVLGPPDDQTYDAFRHTLREAEQDGVVVHCGSGNRVAGMLIPYLVLDKGVPKANALQTAMEAGLRSRELADAAQRYIERITKQ